MCYWKTGGISEWGALSVHRRGRRCGAPVMGFNDSKAVNWGFSASRVWSEMILRQFKPQG